MKAAKLLRSLALLQACHSNGDRWLSTSTPSWALSSSLFALQVFSAPTLSTLCSLLITLPPHISLFLFFPILSNSSFLQTLLNPLLSWPSFLSSLPSFLSPLSSLFSPSSFLPLPLPSLFSLTSSLLSQLSSYSSTPKSSFLSPISISSSASPSFTLCLHFTLPNKWSEIKGR